MISIEQLDFRYREGDFRLHVPALSIARGETVAFIGPSGTGKTTLLHLVAGIRSPATGRVEVDGTDLAAVGDAARRRFRITRMGLVFQEFELVEYLGILDNILLPYRLTACLRLTDAVRQRATALAREVGVGDKLRRKVTRLSQGEKQRVAVCRALLAEPTLLLADEPTGNLDPVNKTRVLDILFAYVVRAGATMVTVTHDHDLLGRFDRVIDFKDLPDERIELARAGGAAPAAGVT
jgi:putative ABC transport system ATP-binding protein